MQRVRCERGQMVFTLQESEYQVFVLATDNGPGLPEKVRARLFEPYTTTKPVGEGMG